MTLRTRLTLFFVGIVVLPLVAATLAFQLLSAREADARTNTRLGQAQRAVGALWRDRLALVEGLTETAARRVADDIGGEGLGQAVAAARTETGLDFVVVSTPAGSVLAAGTTPSQFRSDAPVPTAEQIAAAGPLVGVMRARVEVLVAGEPHVVTGGRYADGSFVRDLAAATGLDVAVVGRGMVLASTTGEIGGAPAGSSGELENGRRWFLVPVGAPGDGILLVAGDDEPGSGILWLVTIAGLGAASILGWALATTIARPLERLAEGARRVAGGDLDTRVEGGGATDVAGVAQAFNTMTEYLRSYIGQLESSRDELRRGLDRMGGALQTTLFLGGMLEVVLDSAAVTLGASAGALFLRRSTGRELALEVSQGYPRPRTATLTLGEGIAGRAAGGLPVLVPRDEVGTRTPVEPPADTAVAVPLVRGDRTIGVIALYGRTTPDPFDEEDAGTLASFAGQASVAIENVLLHQETQQLSITDGLTGVWNRRYLELSLRKEIERASRFGRPLSVLMLDIDRFKRINDQYGHQRGDEVLVELTHRLVGSIRTQIDSVARYGGEEFVVVLPETPVEGARVVAEKVRSTIRERAFLGDSEPKLQVTVSLGVAGYPSDGLTSEDLVRAADRALYRAKRAGRDRVETASAA